MRLLVLGVGNTSLFGAVFTGEKLGALFRAPIAQAGSVTENPSGLRSIRGKIDRAVLCSVVPALTRGIMDDIKKHCGVVPHVLTADAPHGLKIGYTQPLALGTDRLAAALGARALFPGRHVIVVDCGTATTVTAVHRDGIVLGGAIFPGLALWPEMLAARTAQLPRVALRRPSTALGRSPSAGIAAGVYHGHVGAIRELVTRVKAEAFPRASVVIVGTGGHAARFTKDKIFNVIEPALVLRGLRAFAGSTAAA